MAVTHSQKIAILGVLEGQVATQASVLLLTTKGAEASLDSTLNFKLRQDANKAGIKIQVVKNTLIRRVFAGVPELTGPTYLAYLEDGSQSDEVRVAKALVDLIKKDYKENISVLGAVVNGEFLASKEAIKLASTPTLKDSMAMLAGALNQVTARIAIAIQEVPAGVARGLNAYSKTLS